MTKPEDAPVLEEWVSATEISAELGISRQQTNRMIHNGEFETLHVTRGSKPQYFVSRAEVDKIRETRIFPRSKGAS